MIFIYMCIYIYMYIYVYIYVYIYMYMYIYIYTYHCLIYYVGLCTFHCLSHTMYAKAPRSAGAMCFLGSASALPSAPVAVVCSGGSRYCCCSTCRRTSAVKSQGNDRGWDTATWRRYHSQTEIIFLWNVC